MIIVIVITDEMINVPISILIIGSIVSKYTGIASVS
jgi:hypothetical protein